MNIKSLLLALLVMELGIVTCCFRSWFVPNNNLILYLGAILIFVGVGGCIHSMKQAHR